MAAENVIFFPNWSEIARFQHVADADVDVRNQLGLPITKIILYSGNIGEKQGLKTLLKLPIACAMKPLIFAIVGQAAAKRG